ncbi:hypothetical protein AB1Y20_018994 [Prymnesium parvum]|uniref:Uncharacterized protein n=1 Tax=Prymnesium parvum TaxID=97485 RepID=A0AB34JPS3_PRYPA
MWSSRPRCTPPPPPALSRSARSGSGSPLDTRRRYASSGAVAQRQEDLVHPLVGGELLVEGVQYVAQLERAPRLRSVEACVGGGEGKEGKAERRGEGRGRLRGEGRGGEG